MGFFDTKLSLFSDNSPIIDALSTYKCIEYYKNTPVIQQCVQVIAQEILTLVGEEMSNIVTYLLITGEVFLYYDHDNVLQISLPHEVHVKKDKLQLSNNVHVEKYVRILYNPTGVSPLKSVQMNVEICTLIKQHYLGLLQNGARPSGILTHASIMSTAKRESTQKELRDLYKNMERGSIAVLEGSYEWNPIGICPEKLHLLENYKYFSKEICMAFGVPPFILGITDPTFSNYQEARNFLTNNTCHALIQKIDKYLKQLTLLHKENENESS